MQTSASPPPLRHPVPTHPAYIPEPPATPGYQRYSSSPQYPQPPPSGPVPAYAAYRPPQQPVPPQGSFNAPPPDFNAWGMNDATAQIGLQVGQSAIAAGQDYVQKNFGIGSFNFKPLFNVSNSYVLQKLQIILFPWTQKSWKRNSAHAPPREDINAPDLYIPTMAVVTYVLLSAIQAGLTSQFHPQVLGESASKALVTLLVDFLFVYVACYFLNVSVVASDVVAYIGYKFVSVIAMILPGVLYPGGLGTLPFYGYVLYVFSASAFFMLRSLRNVILPAEEFHPTRRTRVIFLLIEATVCQALYMAILVRV